MMCGLIYGITSVVYMHIPEHMIKEIHLLFLHARVLCCYLFGRFFDFERVTSAWRCCSLRQIAAWFGLVLLFRLTSASCAFCALCLFGVERVTRAEQSVSCKAALHQRSK